MLAAPAAGAVNDRILYLKNNTLWSADSTGGNQQLVTEGPSGSKGTVTLADLSPNGQQAVYAGDTGHPGLYLVNLATGAQSLIYPQGGDPMFSPDAKKVIFSYNAGSTETDIAAVGTDGTGFTKLIAWKGQQYDADYSPDGSKIAFTSNTESKGKGFNGEGTQVFVANANGSSPLRVTHDTGGITKGSWFGTFAPTGTQLAFTGGTEAGERIYTVTTSGGSQTQVTTDSGPKDDCASWSPDGSRIMFSTDRLKYPYGHDIYTVNATGGGEQPLVAGDEASLSYQCGTYRHASTTTGFSTYLADSFEPVLRFDTSESWRPLNVEKFFEESQHHLCEEGSSCETAALTSWVGLNAKRSPNAYVDIAGTPPEAGEYHSPYAECTVNGLRDCDTGSRSAIYYRFPGVSGGYEYVDYWFFYRANYFWEGTDFHEGDWEGMTVAPSLHGDGFDYAAFSQHGKYYSYARSVLRCEDSPAGSLPERGTCGPTSKRIDDLVANGDHANYTTPCSETTFMGWFIGECKKNDQSVNFYERGYDGQQRWGRAYDDPTRSLLRMPAVGTSSWVDWPGKWGAPGGSPEGSGPESPANHTFAVECASLDNEPGCETGPRIASVQTTSRRTGSDRMSSPGLTAATCSHWMGAGIAAVACNPTELHQAVLAGSVGTVTDLRLTASGAQGSNGGGRGISQLAGRGALGNDAELAVSGRITSETQILIRGFDKGRRHLVLGRFNLGRYGMAQAAGRHSLRLRLKVGKGRDGRTTVLLGRLRAASVHTEGRPRG